MKKIPVSEQFLKQISNSQKEAKSIPLAQIHDRSHSWFGTGTLIKSGEVNNDITYEK